MPSYRARPLGVALSLIALVAAGRTVPAADSEISFVVVGPRATGVELLAADYLARFVSAYTTGTVNTRSASAPFHKSVVIAGTGTRLTIPDLVSEEQLNRIEEEGYAVFLKREGRKEFLVIAAKDNRGVLYGAAEVGRRIGVGQNPWTISLLERPAFPFRCLWSWTRPSPNPNSFFNYAEMSRPQDSPRYQQFGELLLAMRINSFCFWGRYGEEDGGDPTELEQTRTAYRRFTDFLKLRYGVDSYVFMVYGMGEPTKQALCINDPANRARWQKRVKTLMDLYPNFKGIIMAGAGGDWVRAPWECPCEECAKQTDRELLLEAMRVIGEPLAKRDGRLIWKAVTDRPTRVKSEVEHFGGLTGVIPEYVSIAFKTFYKDFRPPHPYNAMFYTLSEETTRTVPYVTEFQILGEYRGLDQFPCSMVDRWAPIFRMAEARGQQGVIGVVSAEPGPNIDHPLNSANWYAFGRWAWNPRPSPETVLREWATLEFGPLTANKVTTVLRESYEASTRMMFMKGIMTQNHSRLPSINHELESSLVGPWHDIPRAPEGHIGRGHDLSMYPEAVAEGIRNDPALELFAHRVPLTPQLAGTALSEKQTAIRHVSTMIERWKELEPLISPEKYRQVLIGLEDNLNDARLWEWSLRLYLRYKLGELTREELAESLATIREGFPQGGSLLSAGEPLRRFLAEWQAVLDGTFKRRVMEGKHYSPPVEDFPPGLAESK